MSPRDELLEVLVSIARSPIDAAKIERDVARELDPLSEEAAREKVKELHREFRPFGKPHAQVLAEIAQEGRAIAETTRRAHELLMKRQGFIP